METAAFVKVKEKITENCRRIIVGKDDVIEQILICLIASGHILLEDVPGTGKTCVPLPAASAANSAVSSSHPICCPPI